jgi:hypothetical protein
MKLMRMIVAVSLLAATSSLRGATLDLSLKYLGSIKGTIAKPTAANYTAEFTSLHSLSFFQPTSWTSDWNHWFEVDMRFNPANSGEDFYGLIFNILMRPGSGATLTPEHGSSDLGTAIWKPFNPTDGVSGDPLFDVNGDGGPNSNDLAAMAIIKGDSADAAATQTGEPSSNQPVPVPLGWFAVSATLTQFPPSSIYLTPGIGNFFQYYTTNQLGNSTTYTPGSVASFRSSPFDFNAFLDPEPPTIEIFAGCCMFALRPRRRRFALQRHAAARTARSIQSSLGLDRWLPLGSPAGWSAVPVA